LSRSKIIPDDAFTNIERVGKDAAKLPAPNPGDAGADCSEWGQIDFHELTGPDICRASGAEAVKGKVEDLDLGGSTMGALHGDAQRHFNALALARLRGGRDVHRFPLRPQHKRTATEHC
jgi:hypothetical protein